MAKNQFSPLNKLPDENDLKKLVGNFEYRRLDVHELPEPIASNGLTKKCNSFIMGASGSTAGMLYTVNGLRPDGKDMDQNPFVFYYDYTDPARNFGGIIHHGDWPDRTVPLEQHQIDAMIASGLTASFTYLSIPPGSSGSLGTLNENGMLSGISEQFNILFKNKPE
jgi:hypothetical protein